MTIDHKVASRISIQLNHLFTCRQTPVINFIMLQVSYGNDFDAIEHQFNFEFRTRNIIFVDNNNK